MSIGRGTVEIAIVFGVTPVIGGFVTYWWDTFAHAEGIGE